jgi:hypothetical protein
MSTNPTSGLTGNTHDNTLDNTHNTSNEKGGVIPTVLSYVGLGGNNSTSSNTASDATREPAFGAAVGPHSSDSSSTGGILGGSSNTHNSSTGGILGGSNSGSTGSGILPGSSNTHSSSTGGILGGDNTHNSSTGGILGGNNTHSSSTGSGVLPGSNTHSSSTGGILPGSNTHNSSSGGILGSSNSHNTHSSSTGGILGGNSASSHDGYAPAPTLNPHDEERARVVAERAMGSTTTGGGASGLESGSGLTSGQHAGIGSTGGLTSGQHVPGAPGIGHESGHHGSGVGSGVGLGSGVATGAGLGSGLGSDRHGSALDSDRHGSGAGLSSGQHGSGLDSGRHGSGVGSGVGLSSGQHGSGLDSDRHGSGVGSGVGLDSSDSARHGSEYHDSTSGENSHKPPVTAGHKGALENKSSIPTAGGIKLGEKHWGESDIVPEFPKVREEEKIASSSGQPDSKFIPQSPGMTTDMHLLTKSAESTRDNTSANTGHPSSGHGEHGEQKEGIVDKVKDALHMGGHKKE